ncbi:MAG: hypothetical protein M1378_00775, partial [Bacteroidetes bacterium]|nr:hypothetical protein [Bacteroidota bacterium]
MDAKFSLLVRERDGFTCRKCGRQDKRVECAHIYSRKNRALRWEPTNATTLCYYCHIIWSHHEPLEFAQWIEGQMGEGRFAELTRKAKGVAAKTDIDLEAVNQRLDAELKAIDDAKKAGSAPAFLKGLRSQIYLNPDTRLN